MELILPVPFYFRETDEVFILKIMGKFRVDEDEGIIDMIEDETED